MQFLKLKNAAEKKDEQNNQLIEEHKNLEYLPVLNLGESA
jgi:hypothetical protein